MLWWLAVEMKKRPPIPIEPRRGFSLGFEFEVLTREAGLAAHPPPGRLTEAVALLRIATRCARCGCATFGDFDLDHRIPRAMGGAHTPDNIEPLCRETCHPAKTRRDVAAIAKAKRLSGETGGRKTRHPIPQRAGNQWPSNRKLTSRNTLKRRD